jgi:hypothetical protein
MDGRQSPLRVLGEDRTVIRALLSCAFLASALVGCSGDASPDSSPKSALSSSPSESQSVASKPPRAKTPPRPRVGACYHLGYAEAIAPTTTSPRVPCRQAHTAVTYFVGELDTVVDGHLLAVDAKRVQRQIARECPRRLPAYLRADAAQLRLSVLRAVWFSPTLDESDRGENWFRCDAIALGGDHELARLDGELVSVLDGAAGRLRYGICGTSAPGSPGFERIICSADAAWRAIAAYDVRGRDYPGEQGVQAVAQKACKKAGRAVADDALNYRWGFDWPTAKQWRTGQRFGLCWAPAA